ncbi:MAG: SpoIIE family protein phosphatase [Candidatus Aminicenantes bacterium]|nr:SpoIIE family protein phosphatase [Candidatus Aminicenantes bacterium]NIM78686.1 SpoIIE family protein phosphatase [Candidatus Aminicenantes bacterium]NIN17934.1 SpoIIE family protein phosphatase [Candidatus Aminicenantes bacterium]NIN41837.1 SpoIIE family protein phosphatase [Candidatus Aminicenantes bacterium]NIN84589.1 SpoIIE family protein phosphatase [Candidatus Aminicenantes bacterium]
MQEKNRYLKQHVPLMVCGAVGLLIFIILLNHFFPGKAANLKKGKSEAIEIAYDFMKQRGYDLKGYRVMASVEYNPYAFLYLQKRYGWSRAMEIFQKEDYDGLDFYWRVFWFKNLPKTSRVGQFSIFVSGTGNILGFIHDIPQNAAWPEDRRAHISQEQALEIATAFLKARNIDLTGYKKDTFTTQKYEKRTDHLFSWVKEWDPEGSKARLRVDIRGDDVGQFNIAFGVPESKHTAINQIHNSSTLSTFISYISAFLFCLIIQVIFLKKYHEGEVGIKSGAIVFFICWITLALEAGLKFRINAAGTLIGEMSYDTVAMVVFIFYTLIVWPFLSIMAFGSWSVGESLGRERFHKTFTGVDSLFNGKFFTLNAASSLLKGYFAGFLLLGVIALCTAAAVKLFNGQILGVDYQIASSLFPFMVPLLAAISCSFISELVFRLFGNFFLYKYLKSKWGSIFVSSIFWTIFAIGFWYTNISLTPMVLEWITWYICGLLLGYVFWKFDLLTVIVANFTVVGVMQSLPLVTSPAKSLFYPGIISLILLFLPIVFIIRGFIKRKEFSFAADLVPRHIKRITQRARMAKELEIARQVQMKLLPGKPPEIIGFEIEGICIPANEVGGDYYDFIPIDESRIGIVIGDVSGKGVPAAIYMTLTKGIIHSQVEKQLSPELVLTRVNRSLYAMMDNKSFVTLFLGVIDIKNKTLAYSRAGHNPLLYFRRADNQIILLKPGGIALGLEKGQIFDHKIKKEQIQLQNGDLIVFYTDGFSEAMNKDLEEYGEKRLMDVIQYWQNRAAKEIIHQVVADVRAFTRGYPQHDDMTMVVVKVF